MNLDSFSTRPKLVIVEDVWTELLSCDAEYGILGMISTGINSFAKSREQDAKTIGGWGSDLSDHGGGYFVGRRALQVVLDGYDKRSEVTLQFCSSILAELGLASASQIPDWYEATRKTEHWRASIASLAKTVCKLAEREFDPCASQILAESTREFERSMNAIMSNTAEEFFAGERKVPLCLAGGLAMSSKHFQRSFLRVASAARGGAIPNWPSDKELEIMVQKYSPMAGVLAFGIIRLGSECGPSLKELLERLSKSGRQHGMVFRKDLIKELNGEHHPDETK